MAKVTFELEETLPVGENAMYGFHVGRIGQRWLGFAIGRTPQGRMMFVFPEISDNFVMGIFDYERAVRMTAAIAQDPEHAYGGIDRWFITDGLRAKPADFRCETCDRVCCGGECRDPELYDPEDFP